MMDQLGQSKVLHHTVLYATFSCSCLSSYITTVHCKYIGRFRMVLLFSVYILQPLYVVSSDDNSSTVGAYKTSSGALP